MVDFNNIVLITSVINPVEKPLSYTKTRSVYTKDERFEQTKKTIRSLDLISDKLVILIEGSNIESSKEIYLKNNVNLYKNLFYDKKKYKIIKSKYKLLGEVAQTLEAVEFIKSLDVKFNNFFKITGRYHLTENFEIDRFNNDKFIVKKIDNDINNVITSLYKVPYKYFEDYFNFLKEVKNNSKKHSLGIEKNFANFLIRENHLEKDYIDHLGIFSIISVNNDKFEA
jgi:hypothetical protein